MAARYYYMRGSSRFAVALRKPPCCATYAAAGAEVRVHSGCCLPLSLSGRTGRAAAEAVPDWSIRTLTLPLQDLLFPEPRPPRPSMRGSSVQQPSRKRGPPERFTVVPAEPVPRKKVAPDDNRCVLGFRPPNCPLCCPGAKKPATFMRATARMALCVGWTVAVRAGFCVSWSAVTVLIYKR